MKQHALAHVARLRLARRRAGPPSSIVAHDDDEPIAQKTSLGFDRVHHSVGGVCSALEMRGRVAWRR
jgi:hypothetical protein